LPGVGDLVRTPDGDGEVLTVNVLRQLAKVAVQKKKYDDPSVSVYAVQEIKILERRPQPDPNSEQPEREGKERKHKNNNFDR
jgi:hypothetical protein